MQTSTLQKINTHPILGFYEAKLYSEKSCKMSFFFSGRMAEGGLCLFFLIIFFLIGVLIHLFPNIEMKYCVATKIPIFVIIIYH